MTDYPNNDYLNKPCSLCAADLAPIITQSEYWSLVLNRNQNLLGKCFLSLRRHAEKVTQLTPSEWADLHRCITRSTQMLETAFEPDEVEYIFVQNQDKHIHLHIVPRYSTPCTFGRNTFVDENYAKDQASEMIQTLLPSEIKALALYLSDTLTYANTTNSNGKLLP